MLEFPLKLELILLSYIKQTYLGPKKEKAKNTPFNDRDIAYFSRGAKILSDAFTEDRQLLPANYFNDPVLRSGYLLYFLPVNALKVVQIMEEFQPQELLSGKVRILDIGSGPGTGLVGFMTFYAQSLKEKRVQEAWLEFNLIDQNYSVLKDANSLHQAYARELAGSLPGFHSVCSVKHFDIRREGLARFLRGFKYHFILVENVLNEFRRQKERLDFLEMILRDHLDPNQGKLIIIEPAAKRASRDLQELRDELVLNRKVCHVWSPCLHQEVCPLNVVNKRDWCHFYFHWKRPAFIAKVDKAIGNQKDWLACSYLVLSKKEREWKRVFSHHEKTWRVISNLIPSKGKKEVVLCGPPGRYHLERLDRDLSPQNRLFGDLKRGDLIEVDLGAKGKPYDVDGYCRMEKKTVVKRICRT